MSIIMWEAAMSYANLYFSMNETSLGPKSRKITNWEPYFVLYFQMTLVSQRHSSVLINKNNTFYVNELSIRPCMFYIQDASPSRSMQHRSRNPVRIQKLEQDFPDFWIEFYAGFFWMS